MYELNITRGLTNNRPKYLPKAQYPSYGVYNNTLKCQEQSGLTLSQAQAYILKYGKKYNKEV